MRVGLLALQGAFVDHYPILKRLGVSVVEIRGPTDLLQIERLIIPGGESTVMAKYIKMFNMTLPLRNIIAQGLPVWGICAGCILLANTVDQCPGPLKVLNISVHRNAYGRQSQSAVFKIIVPKLQCSVFSAPFIRAPKITWVEKDVEVHADYSGDPVFVQQGAVMATTFHPELTGDPILHDYFLNI
ncbi:MAG: pyridoxal 5'-phosphate synthase glutaminase subunit PdxT [Desulfobacteraceae bacterium]|jgi:5'-phosphate synthase pdxT subunit